ncbi:hypothetical protein K491DRAFT_720627 [Lophiostoma macrostomum CBS 122681]|uniref:Uncharacterized protein n=1 Tax=Lophiostoma macrostomum CBS 122681 TaxID=1314788 RepID=A0A6A6SS23_9PLEO|nr:hypothetical protein K491DRAFT_720627 [Lophiostoma macrostomum CBS 122681]
MSEYCRATLPRLSLLQWCNPQATEAVPKPSREEQQVLAQELSHYQQLVHINVFASLHSLVGGDELALLKYFLEGDDVVNESFQGFIDLFTGVTKLERLHVKISLGTFKARNGHEFCRTDHFVERMKQMQAALVKMLQDQHPERRDAIFLKFERVSSRFSHAQYPELFWHDQWS